MVQKVLGKGLEALIPIRTKEDEKLIGGDGQLVFLPMDKIRPGKYQPRLEMKTDEIKELANSIKEKGIIQPIVVRKLNDDDHYEIVAGGRRHMAAKSLAMKEMPVIIKELSDQDALIFAIVENLQRKSLNGIDEAQALKKLMDEFNFTLDEMARVLGKDKTTIANTVRLLKLPVNIQEAVRQGVITSTQARTILGVNNEDEQKKIFYQIVTEKLSVREIEKRVQKKKGKKEEKDPFVIEVQDSLQKNLGTKVQIINKKKNKGKIVIEYYGLEDLERILKRIK